MSFEFVFQITLISSGLGLLAVVSKKIPQLLKITEIKIRKKESSFIELLIGKIRSKLPFKNFSYDIFLQKFISRIRILTLKTDNKTLNWLQKLREKTQNKLKEGSNYWEELKKIKK